MLCADTSNSFANRKPLVVVVTHLIIFAGKQRLSIVFDLDDISFGADEGDAAILPIHQHLPPEVLTQQVLQHDVKLV